MIIVIGHKNPDTDSVCASIVWADFLNRQKKAAQVSRAGELNSETKFVLDFFKQKTPALIDNLAGKEVFLIDHTEHSQSAAGMEKAKLVGVLDHHHLGGLVSIEPVYYRNEVLGSSSTLVAKLFDENGVKLNKIQASLLLAGLISDTLKFTSPTTTTEDKKIAQALQKISKININQLAAEMFKAKSSLEGLSISDILEKDYKEFEFSGQKVGIGVWETVSPATFDGKTSEILAGLEKLKAKRGMNYIFFAVVDILKQEAFIYLISEKEISVASQIFKGVVENNIMKVAGLVSRKKQMVPVLAKYFEK